MAWLARAFLSVPGHQWSRGQVLGQVIFFGSSADLALQPEQFLLELVLLTHVIMGAQCRREGYQ